jgi:hypothetical protein
MRLAGAGSAAASQKHSSVGATLQLRGGVAGFEGGAGAGPVGCGAAWGHLGGACLTASF